MSRLGEFGVGWRWEEGRRQGTLGLGPTLLLPTGLEGVLVWGSDRGAAVDRFVGKVGSLFPRAAVCLHTCLSEREGRGGGDTLAEERGRPS